MSVARWLSPAVVIAEVILVSTGRLGLGHAVVLGVILEGGLAVMAATLVVLAARGYRRQRAAGADDAIALRDALEQVVPRPVAAAIWHEWGVLGAIVNRIRGRRAVSSGQTAISYGRDQRVFILVMCALSAGEILLLGWLLPWEWARVIALILGVYGMVWILGFYCAMRTRPHVVGSGIIEIRCAHLGSVRVPVDAVVSVQESLQGVEARNVAVDGTEVTVTLSGTTSVMVGVRDGTELTVKGRPVLASSVRFTCDDPAEAVRVIERVRSHPAA